MSHNAAQKVFPTPTHFVIDSITEDGGVHLAYLKSIDGYFSCCYVADTAKPGDCIEIPLMSSK